MSTARQTLPMEGAETKRLPPKVIIFSIYNNYGDEIVQASR